MEVLLQPHSSLLFDLTFVTNLKLYNNNICLVLIPENSLQYYFLCLFVMFFLLVCVVLQLFFRFNFLGVGFCFLVFCFISLFRCGIFYCFHFLGLLQKSNRREEKSEVAKEPPWKRKEEKRPTFSLCFCYTS